MFFERTNRFVGFLLLALAVGFAVPAAAPGNAQDRFAAPNAAYAKKDFATAHRLWLEIAEEGNASAYFNLGRLYFFGEGVPLDPLEAYKWFYLADKQGFPQAKSGVIRVRALMTPEDLTEAMRRVERWYDLHPSTRRP